MPSLVKGGPKLPSFQKVKSKKRSHQETAESVSNAPPTKKRAPLVVETPKEPQLAESKPMRPKKAEHAIQWKKRMAEEKKERLKKREQKEAKSQASPAPKITPGQNWEKFKVRLSPILSHRRVFSLTEGPD